MFYLPIFFVNEVGFSAAIVGLAIASASITGVLGRFLGGVMVDSRGWGRKRTLFLAVFLSGLGALALSGTDELIGLFCGNLLMGLGTGLYWPATETMVADLSQPHNRRESFALTRIADSIGLGLGVVSGGLLISLAQVSRWLFIGDAISFGVFLVILYFYLPDKGLQTAQGRPRKRDWFRALRDRRFLTYMAVNCLITTYIAIFANIIPLYLKNFSNLEIGVSELQISFYFGLYLIFSVVLQIPITKVLQTFSHTQALRISLLFWGAGFIFVAIAGSVSALLYTGAIASMLLLAIATVSYTPVASTLVVELAPENLRGVYLSLNAQCWAIGYFVGPAIGGAAMDLQKPWVDWFWIAIAGSIGLGLWILNHLQILISSKR